MFEKGKCYVLLKEIFICATCQKRFLGFYPLSKCENHEGLEEVQDGK